MRKKLYEDVETVYKVISVIFPDEEEIEEFNSKEDAMEYAQEQISSEDYNEVIVSEVTIDEDGYEDETILLDEQSYHEDDEEYEPQLTTDPMHAGQWYESLHEESGESERTEQDWKNELKDSASRISQIIKKLQNILNREKPPYYPYPGNIKTYIDQIHYYFLKGDENEVNDWLDGAEKGIISKMADAIKKYSTGIKIKDSDFDYGDDENEESEYLDSSERYFFRVYFHDENEDELFAVDDGGYDFESSYNTEEEALAAMKKILKDPKVQADPEIAGCHSVFVPDTEDVREVEEETGYEEFEVVDWIDKENLKEHENEYYEDLEEGKQSEFQIECKFKDDPEWYELVGCDGIYYEIDEITNGELSKYEKKQPHEYIFPTKEIADKFASIVRKLSKSYGITKVRVTENKSGEFLDEYLKESFKSKDKYSVLREALDRLDEEDNKGKKIKARAQIRNLRSKLKESKTTELKEDISIKGKMKTILDFFTKEDIEGIAQIGGDSLKLAEEAVEGKVGPYMKRMGFDDDWFIKGVKWRVKRKFGIDKKEQFKNLSPEDIISLCYIIDRAIENQEDALDTAISEETSDKINDLYPDMYQDPNFPKIYKMVAKYYNLDYNKCINSIK